MIHHQKYKWRVASRQEEIFISNLAHFHCESHVGYSSDEILHAAITCSSVGVAVFGRDCLLRFFNPAIHRLLGEGAACVAGGTHLATMLGALGIDAPAALAAIASHGGWNDFVSATPTAALELPAEMHVAVEAFKVENEAAGWLITARVHATPPVTLTDYQLIALSAKLTPRECEVVLALQQGESNKVIARRLDISPRTVEFHRARIMQRFAATSVVDLVRKVAGDALAAM